MVKREQSKTTREYSPPAAGNNAIDSVITLFKEKKFTFITISILILLMLIYLGINFYSIINISFIEDDWFIIERAGMIKDDPWSFFSLTFNGFYRPIGYNLPSILFLIIRFNPVVFHFINLSLHLLTGIFLFRFARKFFDFFTGLISAVLYVSYPTVMIAIGFTSSTFQDELSTLFFILTLLFSYRAGAEQQRKKPYLVPALVLLLGAFCKDSWMGLIPALIVMDWVNYKDSRIKERLRRLWVFLIPSVTIILKLLLVNMEIMQSNMLSYMGANITFNNLLYGFTLPFLPFEIFDKTNIFNIIRVFAPIILFVVCLVLMKEYRLKILILIVAFIGVLLSQLPAPLENYIFGWAHLFPLIAFSSILIAALIRFIGNKLKDNYLYWILAPILIILFIYTSHPTSEMLKNIITDLSKEQSAKVISFKRFARSLPNDALIYSFTGPNYYVAREVCIGPKMDFYQIALGKKENREGKGFLAGNPNFLKTKLKLVGYQPNFRAISFINNKWYDKTNELRDWLNQDIPFPREVFFGEN